MNTKEREQAIESLANSMKNVWLMLLSDGMNHATSPETLRLTILEASKQLKIEREVIERARELMEGRNAGATVHSE